LRGRIRSRAWAATSSRSLANLKEPSGAVKIAQKILEVVAQPLRIEGRRSSSRPASASRSFRMTRHGRGAAEERRCAMYRAKNRTEHRADVHAVDEQPRDGADVGREHLRHAIERGLSLHYQPVIQVASGLMVGAGRCCDGAVRDAVDRTGRFPSRSRKKRG
jgi:hypothetical protein